MNGYPIPLEALDDRLAWTGTSGSGKTYNAGTGVERLLYSGARVIIIDPLDVWWGLRMAPDGEKPSRFKPVIFGGPRGDLPLSDRSGALVGETCARMRESCIISLGDFKSTAAERRFMLDFLSALYRNASGEPVHIVFDEADLWAPQLILDKEGDASKLLGQMQTIVRRGRVKGFIPWLITQRPAEISKGVLSQADGLMAFTLTSSQDRDAIGGWIKGQADAEAGKAILASLPGLQLGRGVIWIPRRGILTTEQFPKKSTFDSSRTPKRGEVLTTAALKPLDLGALKDRLAAVEEEAKANDPKTLKAEIAKLQADLILAKKTLAPGADPEELKDAERRGYTRGHADGLSQGWDRACAAAAARSSHVLAVLDRPLEQFAADLPRVPMLISAPSSEVPKVRPPQPVAAAGRPAPKPKVTVEGALSGPLQKIVNAIALWNSFGLPAPTKNQVGFLAGYTPSAGTFNRYASDLRSRGLIEYPSPGRIALTDDGREAAEVPAAPPTTQDLHDAVRERLDGPLVKLLNPLLEAYPDQMAATALGEASGYTASAGTFNRYRSSLRTLELIDYPASGQVRAADWLFPGSPA